MRGPVKRDKKRDKIEDETARLKRVGRGGVRLVDGVDEAVGAEVARDLGHRPTHAEADRADGRQDEGELRHARLAGARGAEQVGHREEDRQRAEAVEDGAHDRHDRVLADVDGEGRDAPGRDRLAVGRLAHGVRARISRQ